MKHESSQANRYSSSRQELVLIVKKINDNKVYNGTYKSNQKNSCSQELQLIVMLACYF